MDTVPPRESLSAALCILAGLAIALTAFGVPAADTREIIGDLGAIIPFYVAHKSEGSRR